MLRIKVMEKKVLLELMYQNQNRMSSSSSKVILIKLNNSQNKNIYEMTGLVFNSKTEWLDMKFYFLQSSSCPEGC